MAKVPKTAVVAEVGAIIEKMIDSGVADTDDDVGDIVDNGEGEDAIAEAEQRRVEKERFYAIVDAFMGIGIGLVDAEQRATLIINAQQRVNDEKTLAVARVMACTSIMPAISKALAENPGIFAGKSNTRMVIHASIEGKDVAVTSVTADSLGVSTAKVINATAKAKPSHVGKDGDGLCSVIVRKHQGEILMLKTASLNDAATALGVGANVLGHVSANVTLVSSLAKHTEHKISVLAPGEGLPANVRIIDIGEFVDTLLPAAKSYLTAHNGRVGK